MGTVNVVIFSNDHIYFFPLKLENREGCSKTIFLQDSLPTQTLLTSSIMKFYHETLIRVRVKR